MKSTVLPILLLAVNLLFLQTAFANNIQVSDIILTGQDTANDFTLVQFNITWQNSWRDPSNYDAAWVFVKYSTDGGGTWNHATLATSGHTAPSGSTIDTPTDGKGVFIYGDAVGSGPVNFSGVQLRWEYGTDVVADNDVVRVKVFAIEMVFVPQGSFSIGDGTISNISGQLMTPAVLPHHFRLPPRRPSHLVAPPLEMLEITMHRVWVLPTISTTQQPRHYLQTFRRASVPFTA